MNQSAAQARIALCILSFTMLLASPLTASPTVQGTGQQPFDVARLLPADTLAHLRVTGEPCHRVGGRLAIARALAEPEVRAFLRPLEGLFEMGRDEASGNLEQLGLEFADVLTLSHGSLSVSFLGMNSEGGGEPIPDVVFTFDFRHARDAGARTIDALLEILRSEQASEGVKKIGGRTIHSMTFDSGPPLAWCILDGVLLAGTIPETIGSMASRGDGAESPNLSSNPRFKVVADRILDRDTAAYAWADAKGLLSVFGEMIGLDSDPSMRAMGLESIEALGYAFTLDGAAFKDHVYLHMPTRSGMLGKLIPSDPAPITGDRIAPANSVAFATSAIDAQAIYEWICAYASGTAPDGGEEVRARIRQLGDQTGVDIEKDLIAQIGSELTFYASLEGQAMVPDLVMIARLKDVDRVTDAIGTMITSAQIPVRKFEYLGHAFRYADIGGLGIDWNTAPPLKPTWTVVDGRLVVTAWPQAAKNLVRGLKSGAPRLADNSDYKAQLARFRESDPLAGNASREYADLKRLVGFVMDNGAPFAQSMIPALPDMPVEMEWAAFPATDTVTKHMFGFAGTSTVLNDGLDRQYTSPTGVLPLYSLLVTSLVFGVSPEAVAVKDPHFDPGIGIVVTAPEPGEDASGPIHRAKLSAAKADVAMLRQAIMMFRLKEGRLPKPAEWPDALTKGPAPYVDLAGRKGGLRDPWGNPYRYETTAANSFLITSHGADGAPGGTGKNADITSEQTGNK